MFAARLKRKRLVKVGHPGYLYQRHAKFFGNAYHGFFRYITESTLYIL
jgi:hypothetical protein